MSTFTTPEEQELEHRQHATFGEFPPTEVFMFNKDEIELFRQWYNSVCDCSPRYLERDDHILAQKVHAILDKKYHEPKHGRRTHV